MRDNIKPSVYKKDCTKKVINYDKPTRFCVEVVGTWIKEQKNVLIWTKACPKICQDKKELIFLIKEYRKITFLKTKILETFFIYRKYCSGG